MAYYYDSVAILISITLCQFILFSTRFHLVALHLPEKYAEITN